MDVPAAGHSPWARPPWAAQIVATRATMPIPMREVADGKLPQDPTQHASWLNVGADQVIEAVTTAGSDLTGLGARRYGGTVELIRRQPGPSARHWPEGRRPSAGR